MRRLLQNIVVSIHIPQDKVEFNDTWFLWDGYYRKIIKFFARLELKYNVFLHKQEHFTCNPKSSIIKRNSIFLATNILYIDLTIFLCTRRTGHKGHSRSASVGGGLEAPLSVGELCSPSSIWAALPSLGQLDSDPSAMVNANHILGVKIFFGILTSNFSCGSTSPLL